jgi:hypothetical protein
MARPIKEGISYFPMDVGFFEDSKIKILRARFGADGVAVYLYYICKIYGDKGYFLKVDEDFDYTMSLDLGMSVTKIAQIRRFLLERSLFEDTLFRPDNVLSARSIQSRYQSAKKGGRRQVGVLAKYWLLDAGETESFIELRGPGRLSAKNLGESRKNADKTEKNAPKESKENKKGDDGGCAFLDFLKDFTDTFYAPNRIQKENLAMLFESHGALNMFEALEETGRRNARDPIAYMRKVLRTLQMQEEEAGE